MRTIIAGGRDYRFTVNDYRYLDYLQIELPISEVVSGACPTGADDCAEHWAVKNEIRVHRFFPDWDKFGRAAGPISNKAMAEYADVLILFPGGKGSASMRQEALNAHLTIFEPPLTCGYQAL